ncbi:spermatogenesis-associated protein 20 [Podochytrium sp. JEL0797]|nr:spermatogenesis-associated protein 20 [Podochytrium sp. JEL0797]
MNKHFVNIKIDREQLPTVDQLYQTYVENFTGDEGGWPLTVWLTPHLKPFFGGTYFSPVSKLNVPSFPVILTRIATQWENNFLKIMQGSIEDFNTLKEQVQLSESNAATVPADAFSGLKLAQASFEAFKKGFDHRYGGLDEGGTSKFPRASVFRFLLTYSHTCHVPTLVLETFQNDPKASESKIFKLGDRYGIDCRKMNKKYIHGIMIDKLRTSEENSKTALEMVELTFKKMAAGGIRDHIGGGFHRYAVDKAWHVPQLNLFAVTRNPLYELVAREIANYVLRDLVHADGAFSGAEDADSENANGISSEGSVYLWTEDEIDTALATDSPVFKFHYGIKKDGNVKKEDDESHTLQGKNVISENYTVGETAANFGLKEQQVDGILTKCRLLLLSVRQKRPKPIREEKILASWNGLMISGLAKASKVLNEPKFTSGAISAALFIERKMYNPNTGILCRQFSPQMNPGFADDYAFLIDGLLELYFSTFDETWLKWAWKLQSTMNSQFWDSAGSGGYFSGAPKQEGLILRMKEGNDKAEPAADSKHSHMEGKIEADSMHQAVQRTTDPHTVSVTTKIDGYSAVRETRLKHERGNFVFGLRALGLTEERFLNLLTLVDFFTDFFMCCLYLFDIQWSIDNQNDVVLANLPSHPFLWVARIPGVFWTAVGFSLYSIFSWVLSIYFADNRTLAFFSYLTIVNALTSFPFINGIWYTPGRFLYIPYFLRSLVAIGRLERVLRLRSLTRNFNFSTVTERTVMLCATLATIMYIGMSSFQYTEFRADGKNYTIFDACYFVVVTMSTVGYGDIAPTTTAGRVIVVCLILTALIVLPQLINGLVEAMADRQGDKGGKFTRGKAVFYVVIGNLSHASTVKNVLESILEESSKREKIVLLGRFPATPSVHAILTSYNYKDHVTYLVGSGMEAVDLERCDVRHANAVYIVPDRFAEDQRREDEENTLRAWAVRLYAPNVQLFVSNLRPNTSAFQDLNVTACLYQFLMQPKLSFSAFPSAMCIDDLTQLVLGLTVMFDGASTLLINLLRPTAPESDYDQFWKFQYGDGSGNEIYLAHVKSCIGAPFNEVSWLAFHEHDITAIGVRISDAITGCKTLVLNPGAGYRMSSNDELIFIAQSEADVDMFVASMTSPQVEIRPSSVDDIDEHPKQPFKRISNHPDVPRGITCGLPSPHYEDLNVPVCRLVEVPVPLGDLIVESASDWEDHLLVCTGDYHVFKFLASLRLVLNLVDSHSLTRVLRSTRLESHFRVVFLAEREPTAEEYTTLSLFPQINFIIGDPREKLSLLNAGIRGCAKVCVMNMGSADSGEFQGSSAAMISQLIHRMHMAKEIETEKTVVLEVSKLNLIKFLHPNPTVVSVITAGASDKLKFSHAPVFASGRVVSAPMLGSMLFQLHKNPCLLEIFLLLCGVGNHLPESLGVQQSWISKIPVPASFLNRTYGELYKELALRQGIIPLGLYRRGNPQFGNKLPFVFTNPLPAVSLIEGDSVFVLVA